MGLQKGAPTVRPAMVRDRGSLAAKARSYQKIEMNLISNKTTQDVVGQVQRFQKGEGGGAAPAHPDHRLSA